MSRLASALGLFEPEEPDENTPYLQLMQGFNRFILEQLHQECNTENNPRLLKYLPLEETSYSVIQQLFGMQIASIGRCQCGTQTERSTTPFVVDLQTPKKVGCLYGRRMEVRITDANILECSL
jgi:PAB-dependent poly(A)-specific ribonuclease subunit 2